MTGDPEEEILLETSRIGGSMEVRAISTADGLEVSFTAPSSTMQFDLVRLALATDSTRVITMSLSTFAVVPHVPGVRNETHGLTHHGNEPEKIAELRRIEEA